MAQEGDRHKEHDNWQTVRVERKAVENVSIAKKGNVTINHENRFPQKENHAERQEDAHFPFALRVTFRELVGKPDNRHQR
ncbi:MAG TPA: hypothetical protein DEH25_01245 [Chloroflexi bacterium]|nr:hypothetical protein [Chloroflexota bacterium]